MKLFEPLHLPFVTLKKPYRHGFHAYRPGGRTLTGLRGIGGLFTRQGPKAGWG